ncbi:glycosyltransferase family 2 protein, partial [Sulfuricurvum sp.]|uniref:glycosyltransferase family 2 protein n=1 Tax=Sulfuricurvum sp. TaxID=2025608 RepID=UPI00260DAA6C
MKDFKPSFSIIIPLYNKEKYIERSLHSILAQTVQNFEIIIVDDGSSDNGPSIVERYEDNRIKLLRQNNAGVSAARNRGIKEATGRYIAFLDADDEWYPDFLETIVSLQEKFSDAKVFCTAYESKYENSDKILEYTFNPLPRMVWEGMISDYYEILTLNATGPMWTGSICIDRLFLLESGGFDTSLKIGEDIELWSRLFVRSVVIFTTQVKSIYYLEVDNSSRSLTKWLDENYKFVITMKQQLLDHKIPLKYQKNYTLFLLKELVMLIKKQLYA